MTSVQNGGKAANGLPDKAKNFLAKCQISGSQQKTTPKADEDPEFSRMKCIQAMVEYLQRRDVEWVEHSKVVKFAEQCWPQCSSSVRSNPRNFFDTCPWFQY